MRKNRIFFVAASAAALMLTACAAPENEMLNQARAAYSAARNDPQIVGNAPTEMNEAAQALQQAERLYEENVNQQRVTHQAYLARQQVAIAREAAQLKAAQDAIAQAEVQRQQVLLEARAREAKMAKQEAARMQQELEQAQEAQRARQIELAQQRAQQLQREAEQAQREAEAARQQAAMQTEQLQREAEQARQEAEAARQQAAMREEEVTQLRQEISEAETRKVPSGIALTLKDVVFPVGKADLNPGSQRTIGKIAEFLREHPNRNLVIEGFTDTSGPAEYNRELSQRRAEAVRDALVQYGIQKERITAKGFGEQYPVATNDTPAGRQLNRRVEIIISDGAEEVSAGAAGARKGQAAANRQLIGTTVRDRQGGEIGTIAEVISNFANGRASFARVSSADGRSYLVPLGALTAERDGDSVTVTVDRGRIENSPILRQGMSEKQYGRQLYEYYGLAYPWEEPSE